MSQKYGYVRADFKLPIQTVTIVPCTDNFSKIISKKQCELRAKEVREKLIDFFEGYTEVSGHGGYFSKERNQKVREPIITVTSFADEEKFKKNKSKWLSYVRGKGEKWGQDNMGVIIENDFMGISRKRIKK